jgi:hypothetical protein
VVLGIIGTVTGSIALVISGLSVWLARPSVLIDVGRLSANAVDGQRALVVTLVNGRAPKTIATVNLRYEALPGEASDGIVTTGAKDGNWLTFGPGEARQVSFWIPEGRQAYSVIVADARNRATVVAVGESGRLDSWRF